MTRIVILGGGFGAVYIAKRLQSFLKKHPEHTLMLISEQPTFVFSPLLHEVAAGIIDPAEIQVELKTVLTLPNYNFIHDSIKHISLKQKKITLQKRTMTYDILVIALGAKARQKGKRTLKTLADALQIRKELAILPTSTHIGVIGGGPTGVELAAELANRFPRVTIYQRAPMILSPVSSRFRESVEKCLKKKKIHVVCHANPDTCPKGVDYLIWCTGVKSELPQTDIPMRNNAGEVLVDDYLRVKHAQDVFSLGDCAATAAPKLAQAAEQQAKIVSANIISILEKRELVPFSFKQKGFLLSVGQFCGVGEIRGFVFSGFFAWWLKRTIYLFKIVGLLPKWKLTWEYTKRLFIPRCRRAFQDTPQQHRGKRDIQEQQLSR